MRLTFILIIICIIVLCIIYFTREQVEGFWSLNYVPNTPCVEDVFGNIRCDPLFTNIYPTFYGLFNPYIPYGSYVPQSYYRRIRRF